MGTRAKAKGSIVSVYTPDRDYADAKRGSSS